MTDDGFDRISALELLFDRCRYAAFGSGNPDRQHAQFVALVAAVDIRLFGQRAGECGDLFNRLFQGVSIIRTSRQCLHPDHEVIGTGAGNTDLDAELVFLVRLAFGNAFCFGGMDAVELVVVLPLLCVDVFGDRQQVGKAFCPLRLITNLALDVANDATQVGTQALLHAPGDKVAILSGNDPVAFTCVFAISRAAAVWCPINPRNEAAENRLVLDAFDCVCLIFDSTFAPLVEQILPDLPKLSTLVCLDRPLPFAATFEQWLDGVGDEPFEVGAIDDIAMIAGTGGTTGQPKGVMLSGRNLETMSALALLTHAAGVLCFPILALGGRIVIMPKSDLPEFLSLIERHGVTHTFLPPTLIYMLLRHSQLAQTRLDSLQCVWYGAAPISAARLEEALLKIGPVMAQLFGQTEAPMMISMMARRTTSTRTVLSPVTVSPRPDDRRPWFGSASWTRTDNYCRPATAAKSSCAVHWSCSATAK